MLPGDFFLERPRCRRLDALQKGSIGKAPRGSLERLPGKVVLQMQHWRGFLMASQGSGTWRGSLGTSCGGSLERLNCKGRFPERFLGPPLEMLLGSSWRTGRLQQIWLLEISLRIGFIVVFIW